ncbi:hypothetical protein ACWIG5_36705 [Streptomyces lydicus]
MGELGQGGGLAGARAGLQGQVFAGVEGVGRGGLFIGRIDRRGSASAGQAVSEGRDEMGWVGVGEQVLQGSFEAVGLGVGVWARAW